MKDQNQNFGCNEDLICYVSHILSTLIH